MLSDTERAQRQAGGIGAVEDILNGNVRMFGACLPHQGAPPAAAGIQCRTSPRQQRQRPADSEDGARIRQAVDDDRRILLDVQRPSGFQFTRHLRQAGRMASDTEDPEAAADRLEAALERIAQAAAREEDQRPDQLLLVDSKEVAARLDGLIDRLRAALAGGAG